jgi:RimJ/RimL family protein N-acetyltransferase
MKVPTLENNRVKLSLLDLSNYKHLSDIANQKKLVQYSPTDIETPETLKIFVQKAIDDYYHKNAIPFIVFDKIKNEYAGCTRYMNIDWKNNVIEIGSTWIGRQFQGTGLNLNMKFLMLQYAFETLNFNKVDFRADERNVASKKAIEKLGATQEGLLRKNVIMLDGFIRDTACYSILKEEWKSIKQNVFKGF